MTVPVLYYLSERKKHQGPPGLFLPNYAETEQEEALVGADLTA